MNIGLTEFFFARQLRLERLSIGFGSMHRRRFATLPGLLSSTEIYSFSGLLQLIYAIYVYWHKIKCLIMAFWDNICVSIYLLPLWTSYLPSIVALSSVYYYNFSIGCINK